MSYTYDSMIREFNKFKAQLKCIKTKLSQLIRDYYQMDVRSAMFNIDKLVNTTMPALENVYKSYDTSGILSVEIKNSNLASLKSKVVYYEIFYELYAYYDKSVFPVQFEILPISILKGHGDEYYQGYCKAYVEDIRNGKFDVLRYFGYIAARDVKIIDKMLARYRKYEIEYLQVNLKNYTKWVDKTLPYPL